jgi:membrane-associated phospholipid phosphatase
LLYAAVLCICLWSPSASAKAPYALRPQTDLALLGGGLLLHGWAQETESARMRTTTDFGELDAREVAHFDRWAIGFYNRDLDALSTALLGAGIAAPAAVNAWEALSGRNDVPGFITDWILFGEVYLITSSLAISGKAAGVHARPLAYGSRAPAAERASGDAGSSFYSAHTAGAFAAAVFTAYTYQLKHPESPAVPYLWGAMLGMAGSVGALRVFSGKHFPSDVAVGALMGAAVGYAVPRLHLVRKGALRLNLAVELAEGGRPAPVLLARF